MESMLGLSLVCYQHKDGCQRVTPATDTRSPPEFVVRQQKEIVSDVIESILISPAQDLNLMVLNHQ